MNTRPTRTAPPPGDVEEGSFTEAPPREAVQQHQPPTVVKPQTPPNDPPPVAVRDSVPLPKTGFAELAKAIAGVMAEIKPVSKSGWNDFHRYNYARMQDLSSELTPLMGKHGIVVFQNELGRDMFDEGRAVSVRYEFTIVHSSGEIWPERPIITGMSMCRTSNGKFDDKTFNKCHTSARKYFLIGLFQIPTEDDADADSDGGTGQKPRPQRRAPSPDGTVGPHLIPIVNGEAPAAWAERFTTAMAKSKTTAEVDQWYDVNFPVFEKMKGADRKLYDTLIDVMDLRTAAIASGDAAFKEPPPADTKPARAPRQRAAAPPPETVDTAAWLTAIENAYSACEDTASLIEAQGKYMTPDKAKVPEPVWLQAVDLTQVALKRIEGRRDD